MTLETEFFNTHSSIKQLPTFANEYFDKVTDPWLNMTDYEAEIKKSLLLECLNELQDSVGNEEPTENSSAVTKIFVDKSTLTKEFEMQVSAEVASARFVFWSMSQFAMDCVQYARSCLRPLVDSSKELDKKLLELEKQWHSIILNSEQMLTVDELEEYTRLNTPIDPRENAKLQLLKKIGPIKLNTFYSTSGTRFKDILQRRDQHRKKLFSAHKAMRLKEEEVKYEINQRGHKELITDQNEYLKEQKANELVEQMKSKIAKASHFIDVETKCLQHKQTRHDLEVTSNDILNKCLVSLKNEDEYILLKEQIKNLNADLPDLKHKLEKEISIIDEMENSDMVFVEKSIGCYISLKDCNKDDLVLVVWSRRYCRFMVVQDSPSLCFVHNDSVAALQLTSPQFYSEFDNSSYAIGRMQDKELCIAKNNENDYRVLRGTQYYCIKVAPINPEIFRHIEEDLIRVKNPLVSGSGTIVPSTSDVETEPEDITSDEIVTDSDSDSDCGFEKLSYEQEKAAKINGQSKQRIPLIYRFSNKLFVAMLLLLLAKMYMNVFIQ